MRGVVGRGLPTPPPHRPPVSAPRISKLMPTPADDPLTPQSSDGGGGRSRPTSSTPAPFPDRTHLSRLRNVWIENPLYFLTCCTAKRRPLLANPRSSAVLTAAWANSPQFHGWSVGRYVIMPDHVHFFARPAADAKSLPEFIRDW